MPHQTSVVIAYSHVGSCEKNWKDYLKNELTAKFGDRLKVTTISLDNIPPPAEVRRNVRSSLSPRVPCPQGVLIVILTTEHLEFLRQRPALDYKVAMTNNALAFSPECSFILYFDRGLDFRQVKVGEEALERRFDDFSGWNLMLYEGPGDADRLLRGVEKIAERLRKACPKQRLPSAMRAKLIGNVVKCDESSEVTIIIEEGLPANSSVQVYLNLPGNPNDIPATVCVHSPHVVTFKTFEHVECEAIVKMTVNGSEASMEPNRILYTSSCRDVGTVSQFYVELIDLLVRKLVSLDVSTNSIDQLMSSVFSLNSLPVQAFELIFNLTPTNSSDAKYPTLLHFAAANGLRDFCTTLNDLPKAQCAMAMANGDRKLPEQLAAGGGHRDLADYLEDSRKGSFDEIYINFIRKNNLNDAEDSYIQSRLKHFKSKGPRLTSEREYYEPEYIFPNQIQQIKPEVRQTEQRQVQMRRPSQEERKSPIRLSEELADLIKRFMDKEMSMTMAEVELEKLKSRYYSKCKNFDEKRKNARMLSEQIGKAKNKMKASQLLQARQADTIYTNLI